MGHKHIFVDQMGLYKMGLDEMPCGQQVKTIHSSANSIIKKSLV